jgi:hypothetical protein
VSNTRLPIIVVTVQMGDDGKPCVHPHERVVHYKSRIIAVIDPDIGYKFDKPEKCINPNSPTDQLFGRKRVNDLMAEITNKCERVEDIGYHVSVLPINGSIDAEAILIVDPVIKNEPTGRAP